MSIDYILVGISALLLLSVVSSRASDRLGVPSLLLFLIIGMVAGSEGPGGVYFDDPWAAQLLGIAALAFILFAGGLDTSWSEVKPVFWKGLTLSTAGVMLTAVMVGWFASTVLGFSLLEGLLLGSIVSSTDAAAVFALLRSKRVGLKGELRPLLELESGSNDPMAVFLTTGLIGLLTVPGTSPLDAVPSFLWQMSFGAASGVLLGKCMVYVINHISLEHDGLYPALTISMVLLTYGFASSMGANGFLATYLAGMTVGNSGFMHRRSLMSFHEGLAWLMQISMFLALGLLVFPSRLAAVSGAGIAISFVLMFIARPAAVFLCLSPARMSLKEKAMISWVGLRGAVPIILATFPLIAGVPRSDAIFNVVFFIVLTSVLVQGSSIPLVARWLGLEAPIIPGPEYLAVCEPKESIKSKLLELKVSESSPVSGKRIVELGLPKSALIVAVRKGERLVMPTGETLVSPGDSLLMLSDERSIERLRSVASLEEPPDEDSSPR